MGEQRFEVRSVSDARDALTKTLRAFRDDPEAEPVVFGSHRKPEAVIVPYARWRFGDLVRPDPSAENLRALVHRRRTLIERLALANRIGRVRLFGSVARGEAGPGSDVDLLVDPEDGASLFDLAQFEIDLEHLLEHPVDVVSSRALDPVRDAAILAEAVPL
ncbi:nucleotidyltransferase family protein [Agromyces archimandritae]|uniref:Nucleotidyltransferase domain-containing protein n=1 Tax=Agromyces archimandritae TaxID=2781962 RepID=A0A975FNI8_9MICO|nr:nucleotidyltransferase domain-containing protein [Agromyces archimandritae]QTX05127.1 nucleotidyltransferase domain-containing protein [Agromyces archimandritae]